MTTDHLLGDEGEKAGFEPFESWRSDFLEGDYGCGLCLSPGPDCECLADEPMNQGRPSLLDFWRSYRSGRAVLVGGKMIEFGGSHFEKAASMAGWKEYCRQARGRGL